MGGITFNKSVVLISVSSVSIFIILTIALNRFRLGSHGGNAAYSGTVFQRRAPSIVNYDQQPLTFESNSGQFDPTVRFSAATRNFRVFLTRRGVALSIKTDDSMSNDVVEMVLQGQNTNARIIGIGQFGGSSNYFFGTNQRLWKTNVRNYEKVKYEDIYPGIDLVFYGIGGKLEWDFVLKPNADASQIRFRLFTPYDHCRTRIDAHGDLTIPTAHGRVGLLQPLTYQEDESGRQVRVASAYKLLQHGDDFGIRVGTYDRKKALVIDPSLEISTYLGGTAIDTANSIAVDGQGNIYVAGTTFSSDFPTVVPFQSQQNGTIGGDIFITKFNAKGSVVYSTYLGGPNGSSGQGIAVDSAGEAYVTGTTNSFGFPTTTGAFQTSCVTAASFCASGFVTKLSADGSKLVYSTYIGGSNGGDNADHLNGIAVDATGAAYVTGGSFSSNFPTTSGSFQTLPVPGIAGEQVVAVKFRPDGSALTYGTYLGPGEGFSIALNSLGEAYIAGGASAGFPVTPGVVQPTFGGPDDAFVTRISADGTKLIYSTFLGGSLGDYAGGIAVDASGDALVTGQTFSPNFPVVNAYQATLKGSANAYIAKLNPSGTQLLYSTYLGGSKDDDATAIAVDSSGNAYITGFTLSPDFPTINALETQYEGNTYAFVARLDPSGALLFSTFLGGSAPDRVLVLASDQGNAIASDKLGNVYVTGFTESDDFPVLNAFQLFRSASLSSRCFGVNNSQNPCPDAFITEFSFSAPSPQPDFAMYVSTPTLSVTAGATAPYPVVITPIGGFSGTVSVSCGGLPPSTECLATKPLLQVNGFNTETTTLEVYTTAMGQNVVGPAHQKPLWVSVGSLFLLIWYAVCDRAGLFRRCRNFSRIALLGLLAMASFMPGCGGGGGGSAGGSSSIGTSSSLKN